MPALPHTQGDRGVSFRELAFVGELEQEKCLHTLASKVARFMRGNYQYHLTAMNGDA